MRTYNRKIFDAFKSEVEDAVDHRTGAFKPKQREGPLRVFWKFLHIVVPYWDKVLLLVLMVACVSVTGLLGPWFGKYLVDDVFPDKDWRLFWIIIGARLGLTLFNWLIGMLRQIFSRYIDFWVYGDLKTRFFDHLIRLSMTFMQNRGTGEHIYRASSDIGSVMFLITDLLPRFVESVFQFFLIMFMLSYLDWRVTVIVLAYMFPYTLVVHWVTSKVRRYDREARAKWERSSAILQDGVSGKMVVKTFARRRFEVKKYLAANITAWRTQMKKRYMYILRGQIAGNHGFIPWIMGWLVRAWFFREAILGHITYGSLLPIFAYMNRFRNPFQRIINLWQTLRMSMVPAERIMETLEVAPVVANRPDASAMPPLKGEVVFENVEFSYEEGVPVLRGLDFRIEPGRKVAFVGHSGAGKSTILNLALRLYDPSAGRVLIDGVDIRTVRMETLQRQVGLVFQDTYLFVGTIRENVLFGNSHASDARIWEAIRQADLEEFVQALPAGLDTDLHEGTSLSGGQKQRLGIARALVRDPRLLILDEPTSSLDSDTETIVLATLRKAMKGRTTIIISHRLPTVVDADVIFAMDRGRVVESGTHEALMAQGGYYHQLYTLYFAGKT